MSDSRPHHHVNDGRPVDRKVFCDGVEVDDVLEANTEQGWYRRPVKGASGRLLVDRHRNEIITMTVRGRIEIVY